MSVLDAIVGVAGSASPLGAVSTLLDKALSFIPNPQDKLALQAHALDVQLDLQKAELAAEAQEIESNKEAQSDHYLGMVRGAFCWMVVALMSWNYGLVFLFNWAFKASIEHVDIPFSVLGMFSTIMLGFIGVPAGIEAVKQILAMPGVSSIKLPGISATNNGGQ
jgi:hypothetical protein